MSNMGIDQINFIHGVELNNNGFLFTGQFKQAGPDQHHSVFLEWSEDGGYGQIDKVMRPTVRMTTGDKNDSMIAISPCGTVCEIGIGIGEVTKVTGEEPPEFDLRYIKKIGESLFATGVNRQCYMRTEGGPWKPIMTDEMLKSDSVTSFESIDGFSENEVYAVGFDGEIWTYNGKDWKQLKSPVDRILYSVCAGEETCLAAGQSGKIVMGRGDTWKEIKQEETFSGENFWSVAYFQGAFYLGSEQGIYKLENEKFSVVAENDKQAICNLSVGPSGLWSVSLNEIKVFNGEDWRTILES